jgi:hypothetical protein
MFINVYVNANKYAHVQPPRGFDVIVIVIVIVDVLVLVDVDGFLDARNLSKHQLHETPYRFFRVFRVFRGYALFLPDYKVMVCLQIWIPIRIK